MATVSKKDSGTSENTRLDDTNSPHGEISVPTMTLVILTANDCLPCMVMKKDYLKAILRKIKHRMANGKLDIIMVNVQKRMDSLAKFKQFGKPGENKLSITPAYKFILGADNKINIPKYLLGKKSVITKMVNGKKVEEEIDSPDEYNTNVYIPADYFWGEFWYPHFFMFLTSPEREQTQVFEPISKATLEDQTMTLDDKIIEWVGYTITHWTSIIRDRIINDSRRSENPTPSPKITEAPHASSQNIPTSYPSGKTDMGDRGSFKPRRHHIERSFPLFEQEPGIGRSRSFIRSGSSSNLGPFGRIINFDPSSELISEFETTL